MHTVDFTPEIIALAYIMIFNLYPVRNLQHCPNQELCSFMIYREEGTLTSVHTSTICLPNVSGRRRFGWLYCLQAWSWVFLLNRVKFPTSWVSIKREDPISSATMIRSRYRLPSFDKEPKGKKSQGEASTVAGGDIDEEIDQFTISPDDVLPSPP